MRLESANNSVSRLLVRGRGRSCRNRDPSATGPATSINVRCDEAMSLFTDTYMNWSGMSFMLLLSVTPGYVRAGLADWPRRTGRPRP